MLSRIAETTVRACRRAPFAVVVLAVLLATAAVVLASKTLTINTDTEALFDQRLPFRLADKANDKLFPSEVDLIVAVIDGPSAHAAQSGADKLAAALTERADLFLSVVNPTGGPFFAHNGLLYLSTQELDELIGKLAAAQPLLGSISTDRTPRGLFRLFELALSGGGDPAAAQLAPLAEQVGRVIENVLDEKPAQMQWTGLFAALAPPGQGARAVVLTQPKLDLTALEQGGDSSAVIRSAARELGLTPDNGFRVRLTGQIPLADEEFASVAEGTGVSGVLSVVLVVILLFMGLGSVRAVAASLLTLVVGLLLTFGWAALTVREINLISIAFAVMFVGMAVDFSIQFCLSYRSERRERRDRPDALAAALDAAGAAMAKPLVLAAAATALGFFSFLPTDYRGVSKLGVIAGGGMIVAVVLSFTLLPALLRLFSPGAEESPVGYVWAAPLNHSIVRRRVPVLVISALVAVVALGALPRLIFDFDPLKLKDPNTESMATALELMNDPLVNPNTLSVMVPTLEGAKTLAEKVSQLPGVDHAVTIADLIPQDQEAKLAAIEDLAFLLGPALDPIEKSAPTFDELTASAGRARDAANAYLAAPGAQGPLRASAQRLVQAIDRLPRQQDTKVWAALTPALLNGFDEAIAPLKAALEPTPVSLETLPPQLRATYIATDGRYRVQIFPKGAGADVNVLTEFLRSVRSVAPDALGAPVVIFETGRVVTRAFMIAAGLSLAAITLLLFVVLRRPGDVARVLAPLLLAGLLTLGTCALLAFPLNFANIIALPLLLGVGVAYPIYFVMAWRAGEPVLLASPSGRGMLYSALTTAAAFGSLAISNHSGTSAMGILLTMALGFTLLATLVFLPALLGPAPQRG